MLESYFLRFDAKKRGAAFKKCANEGIIRFSICIYANNKKLPTCCGCAGIRYEKAARYNE
jgi:hypothetical protein